MNEYHFSVMITNMTMKKIANSLSLLFFLIFSFGLIKYCTVLAGSRREQIHTVKSNYTLPVVFETILAIVLVFEKNFEICKTFSEPF
jgi:uncharacterized membrane protein